MADEPLRKPTFERPMEPKEAPAAVEGLEAEKEMELAPEKVEAGVLGEQVRGLEEKIQPTNLKPASPVPTVPPAPVSTPDSLAQQIESVLSEDLTDIYLKLPPAKQKQFKEKGEQTAGKIRELMAKASVNAKKIFDLIRDWLKIIPGVNRFFLEQEAKIKTDKILRLK